MITITVTIEEQAVFSMTTHLKTKGRGKGTELEEMFAKDYLNAFQGVQDRHTAIAGNCLEWDRKIVVKE